VSVDLSQEIAAFRRKKPELITKYGSVWVVFVADEFKGHFPSFQQAAQFALDRHGSERFLIRHTDEPPLQVPLVAVEA